MPGMDRLLDIFQDMKVMSRYGRIVDKSHMLIDVLCSCLFLPRREPLISALSITPSYLQNSYSSAGMVTDYRDWQIPLGRRFRALKIWFVLRLYGVNGMKGHVKRHIELGEKFAQWVVGKGTDLFEILAPPRFALTVFRVRAPYHSSMEQPVISRAWRRESKVNEGFVRNDVLPVPNGVDSSSHHDVLRRSNAVTKEVYESINATGEIFLTSTMIKDVYAIRVIGANERTDEHHLRKAFDILTKTTEEVLSKVETRKKGQPDSAGSRYE